MFFFRHLSRNRPNDTGILHANIGEEERKARLEKMLSFADENGEFSFEEFQHVAEYYCGIDGCESRGLFGSRGEFATMLITFGKDCQSGRRCLTTDDVTALWVDNEWPEGFSERRVPETSTFTRIDIAMGIQFIRMMMAQRKNEKAAGKPVLTESEDLAMEFRPYESVISDIPGEPVITPEEIATIPGGEICIWDSRAGGVQPSGPTRWIFTEDYFQTTVAEATGIEPRSPLRTPLTILVIGVVLYFLNNWRKSKKSGYEAV